MDDSSSLFVQTWLQLYLRLLLHLIRSLDEIEKVEIFACGAAALGSSVLVCAATLVFILKRR